MSAAAAARDKAAQVRQYVAQLPFEDKLQGPSVDAARALTEAVIKLDSWHPEIKPTVLMKQRGEFILGFSGFKTEIDLATLYRTLISPQREKIFRCVQDVSINFGVGTLTLSIAPIRGAEARPGAVLSRRQKQPRYRDGDTVAVRNVSHSSAALSAPRTIDVSMSVLDMDDVAPHEKAIVARAAIGVLYFNGSAFEVARKPRITETADRHAYKAIFYGLNVELSLTDLYQRMLGPVADRSSHFSIVLNAGLEPGIPAFVMRIGKQQAISDIGGSSSRRQKPPTALEAVRRGGGAGERSTTSSYVINRF